MEVIPEPLTREAFAPFSEVIDVPEGRLLLQSLRMKPLEPHALTWLKEHVALVHGGGARSEGISAAVGGRLLRDVLTHYAEQAPSGDGRVKLSGSAQIVHHALEYIRNNLTRPIGIDALAEAVGASRRSLYRAFSEVLGDTPQNHVRRLRLHRIRGELIANSETTIAAAAHHWGAGQDLGRLSRSYRDLFGENPSSTLAIRRTLRPDDKWM